MKRGIATVLMILGFFFVSCFGVSYARESSGSESDAPTFTTVHYTGYYHRHHKRYRHHRYHRHHKRYRHHRHYRHIHNLAFPKEMANSTWEI